MILTFIRILFVIGGVGVGYQIGGINNSGAIGSIVGLLISAIIIFLEIGMRRVSVRGLSSAVFGLIFGLIMSKLVVDTFDVLGTNPESLKILRSVLTLVVCYLGIAIALRGKDEFNIVVPYVKFSRQDQRADVVVVDTSTIIDGRIADICKTKFMDSKLVVPRFVLRELQQIADSSDPIKRQRGRRGLEILHTLQKDKTVNLIIQEEDFPDLTDVDAKLVKLAKMLEAKIFTMDFNLNRIAELQGIGVLNLNELSNALKSMVFPGEEMEINLLKEGKEHNQAVGYLDDGTMVVVEDAKRLIGQQGVKVVVTSVLQTQAGRMIFSRLKQVNTK